jgi:protease IV
MKDFFKSLLASCLGVFLAFGLLFFILFAIAGASMFADKSTDTSDGFLMLDMSKPLPELTDNVEISPLDFQNTNNTGLRDFIRLIENAQNDSSIKGIVIKADEPANGGATLLAVSDALQKFKKGSKPVYAYVNFASRNGYMLASIADSVMINPNGGVMLNGYSTTMPFIKGLADKLGVKFNIFYAGNFKSATEPLRRTDMSPESKQQTREFLNEYLQTLQNVIIKNRKISKPQLDVAMSEIQGFTPEGSLSSKLVDAIGYQDQFEDMLRKSANLGKKDKIKYISMDSYKNRTTLINKGTFKEKVAILYAEGDVVFGQDMKGVISDEKYIKALTKIRNDDNIKALVLRVNSGGGSAFTSDVIWREIELIKKAGKPVIASFGDYAASGGYYIACGADKIFAYPNTLTGSIGVFSILPNTKSLMNDKLGITFDTVQTLPNSVFLPLNFDLSDKDQEILNASTAHIYNTFLKKVATGRKMKVEDVDKIAQGRVWTGDIAVTNGLVDKIGSLEDAVKEAVKMAKLSDKYKIVEYPTITKDPFQEILANLDMSGEEEDAKVESLKMINKIISSKEYKFFKLISEGKRENLIQARIPFEINN